MAFETLFMPHLPHCSIERPNYLLIASCTPIHLSFPTFRTHPPINIFSIIFLCELIDKVMLLWNCLFAGLTDHALEAIPLFPQSKMCSSELTMALLALMFEIILSSGLKSNEVSVCFYTLVLLGISYLFQFRILSDIQQAVEDYLMNFQITSPLQIKNNELNFLLIILR